MLVAKDVSYKVGERFLLSDISLGLAPGKLNLIIGPNGAGKSTLVKILGSQLKPAAGTVYLDGQPLSGIKPAVLARRRAVLSQTVTIAFPLKVYEVILMGRYPHFTGKPSGKDKEAVSAAMAFFELDELAQRDYLSLSGGEQQRVQFARVLAQIWYPVAEGSRCLILDEPLTFLDIHFQIDLMNKLKELLRQPDILIAGVVHDLNLTAGYADHITMLHNGGVLADGPTKQVLTNDNIKTLYGLDATVVDREGRLHVFF